MKKNLNPYFIYSLIFHGSIILFMSIGAFIYRKKGFEIPNDTAVIVNFVKIGPKSQAPIIGQPPAKKHVEEDTCLEKQEKKIEVKEEKKEEKEKVAEKGEIVKKEKKKKNEKKKEAKKSNEEEKKSDERKGPKQSTPDDAQRADLFGLEIIASEASVILSKLKRYWSPLEIAENSGVKMKVFLSIDGVTWRIKNYYIVERQGPSEFYSLFENRIMAVVQNPDIDFSDLSDGTKAEIAKKGGLLVSFDSDATEF